MTANKIRVCELCNEEASLYCYSDAAFLCFSCDSKVHSANFLVARHIRLSICRHCQSLPVTTFSGTQSPSLLPATCRSCPPETFRCQEIHSISCSSSSTLTSACISSTECQTSAPKTTRFDRRRQTAEKLASSSSVTEASDSKPDIPGRCSGEKVKKSGSLRSGSPALEEDKSEGIFVNWCRMLGLNGNLVISAATHAMSLCIGRLGKGRVVLPFRVSLAASLWFGVRVHGDKSVATSQNLRRLQEVSGVPARLIVAVETKLERALRVRGSRQDLEEGWAECSV